MMIRKAKLYRMDAKELPSEPVSDASPYPLT
jgi:hypothetical protein